MFVQLCTLALALPLVSALTINPPTNSQAGAPLASGNTVTITWTATTTDPPSFSIELVNTIFHNTFAIANNVPTVNGEITIELPQVPDSDGYTMEAIAVNDINTVYSTSGTFSISSSVTETVTGVTSTGSATTLSTPSSSTSTGTVSTPSVTATTPVTTPSAASTAGTSSASSAAPSTFNSSGAASFKLAGVVPAAALVLSAVAGAVMVF